MGWEKFRRGATRGDPRKRARAACYVERDQKIRKYISHIVSQTFGPRVVPGVTTKSLRRRFEGKGNFVSKENQRRDFAYIPQISREVFLV